MGVAKKKGCPRSRFREGWRDLNPPLIFLTQKKGLHCCNPSSLFPLFKFPNQSFRANMYGSNGDNVYAGDQHNDRQEEQAKQKTSQHYETSSLSMYFAVPFLCSGLMVIISSLSILLITSCMSLFDFGNEISDVSRVVLSLMNA